MKALYYILLYVHHVKKHKASMFVLLFLSEINKAVFLIKGNGRKVCIDGNITESRQTLNSFQSLFQIAHQPTTYVPSTIVYGNSQTTYLNARITTKLLTSTI